MKNNKVWEYNDIVSSVNESFFAIQNAWSESDMIPARQYLSEDLFRNFQIKLNWMTYRNQKNVLRDIRLVHALPVAIHSEDSADFVWFYIKGRMIDYIVDTKKQAIISGKTFPSSFEEYWQFTRKEDRWILNKILQKNESDQIPFNR